MNGFYDMPLRVELGMSQMDDGSPTLSKDKAIKREEKCIINYLISQKIYPVDVGGYLRDPRRF